MDPKERLTQPADIAHLRARSKDDLLLFIEALVAERPAQREYLLNTEFRKAAGRILSVQRNQATIQRLKRALAKTRFERDDLIPRVPENQQPEWLKESNRLRAEAKAAALAKRP